MKIKIVIITFLVSIFSACSFFKDPFIVRACINSTAYQAPIVSVYVEGNDGYALTGALVSVVSPGGEAQILAYDSNVGCFKSKAGTMRSGIWKISVSSTLSQEAELLEVEHTVISKAVSVSDLIDGLGLASSQGNSLNSNTAIAITWPEVEGASAYRILIMKGTNLLYEGTSLANVHIIDANKLPSASSITVAVSAQWSKGDPLLKTSNYSSSSISDGVPYHVATK